MAWQAQLGVTWQNRAGDGVPLATLLGGALNLNAALFNTDYKNYQVQIFDNTGGGYINNLVLSSAGKARTRGLELDAQLAAGDNKLVFGVGFLFSDDIKNLAKEFPNQRFACIDYTWSPGDSVPANLVGLKFREEEIGRAHV